ncbi:hypothetical protein COCNU_04G007620 [Cocos nucifera]|uniref:Uncharacterized protein n=1 Tax=Cocos nucifera TaxID=13894 RepID=A0A8K0I5X6_COCNU|nr:hypothetical protein COCNU_04G007620 [Cocos nucifera]
MASRIVEAKLKVIEAEKVAEEQIVEVGHLAVESFKASKKFNNLPAIDLSFLDKNEEEEAAREPIPSEPTAAEEQAGEELMVAGVFPSLTIDASAPMPAASMGCLPTY